MTTPNVQNPDAVSVVVKGQESNSPVTQPNAQPNVDVNTEVKTADAPNIELDITKEPVKTAESNEPLFERGEDPALNLAFDYIERQGFKPGDPAVEAAFEGNFELLKAELEKKGLKDYDAYLKIAEKAYQEEKGKHEAKISEVKKAVVDVVGGEAVWQDCVNFARQHATDEEKREINAMLNSGSKIQAKAIAKYLNDLRQSAPGVNVEPRKVSDGRSEASPTTGTYALTKTQYMQEVRELEAKVGANRVQDTPEYAALVKRREAGRKAGLN